MKKRIVIIIVLMIIAVPIAIKISRVNKMFKDNQILIDRCVAACESNDDIDTFTTKASMIIDDQLQWAQQYKDILKKNPKFVQQIDQQWVNVIYLLGTSLEDESNMLTKEKKAFAIEMIGKNISQEARNNIIAAANM